MTHKTPHLMPGNPQNNPKMQPRCRSHLEHSHATKKSETRQSVPFSVRLKSSRTRSGIVRVLTICCPKRVKNTAF